MSRAILKGSPVSPGIAIGQLFVEPDAQLHEKRHISAEEIDTEIKGLEKAINQVCSGLETTLKNIPGNLSEYRDIIAAQVELARDSKLAQGAMARIRRRKICASWALFETADELCSLFQDLSDPYLADRAQDIKTVTQAIADHVSGIHDKIKKNCHGILAAYNLSPAQLMEMKQDGITGLITSEGGVTSHTAILARGLKIPSVVGIPDLMRHIRQGETVILDGLSGLLILDPDEADLSFYQYRKKNYELFEKEARASAQAAAYTMDGRRISVYANLENPSELSSMEKSGAEGIGLYRTEFAYLGGDMPNEEALIKEYEAVIKNSANSQVIFRTLDVGADKILAEHEKLFEPNPALGLRGIRFCLHRKDIFRTQLRAILRAGKDAHIAIMLPMVSRMQEIDETRAMLEEVNDELDRQHIPHARALPLGIMVETPAAVMVCDTLAAKCDFLSIGTNDLLHYIMAIDRNNRHVSYLHEPLHPACIQSIKQVIDAGHRHGMQVSVCGELAADPFGIALLLGLGIDRLSAAPRFIPGIKHMLRRLNASACAKVANMALKEIDVLKTRALLRDALEHSLGSDLSFHNTFIK